VVLVVGPLEPSCEVLVALASGATGYLPADSDPEAIADAVDALVAGLVVVPRSIFLPILADRRPGSRGVTMRWVDGREVTLTHREWEVFVLLRQGRTNAAIAEGLVVSRATVRSHIASLVRKLGVADRAMLVGPLKR